MIGITSFAAYVPFYRLSRDELARAWQRKSRGGQKAVACYDEDSVTMAVAATRDCLSRMDSPKVEGLFLATTTSPYREKLASTIVATAVDCPEASYTADITSSLRAGTTAMNFALDAIGSGTAKNVMVAASDCRLGAPRGEFESLLGDGAAALLFGNTDVVASVEGRYTVANELLDVWRADKDTYLRSWEDRFVISEGYTKIVAKSVQGILTKYKLTPKDFSKVVLYAPDARSHTNLAKSLGFDAKTQVQDCLINSIGHTGAASVLMMLVGALETSKPGDRILVASYGDGSDAFIFKVTENINKLKKGPTLDSYLQSKAISISYERYLLWRGQIQVEPPRLLEPLAPSASALLRERKRLLALYGQKCRKCGNVQYPPKRLCVKCRGKDEFDDYNFADKKGKVFTFLKDYVNAMVEPPKILCVIDFEGGGRMQTDLADSEPDEVKVDLPVEMTFRKLQDTKGIHHYFWKCRPVR